MTVTADDLRHALPGMRSPPWWNWPPGTAFISPARPYNWSTPGIPLTPDAAASHFHGKVPKGWHAPGGGADAARPRLTGPPGRTARWPWGLARRAPGDSAGPAGPCQRPQPSGSRAGQQVRGERQGRMVGPGVGGEAGRRGVSARWKSKEQKVAQHEGGKTTYVTHPAMDERVLTPYVKPEGRRAAEARACRQTGTPLA